MIKLKRETRETTIRLAVGRTGREVEVKTSEPFLSHMVETLARYSGLSLKLEAEGDLRHHLVEDVGIALGLGIRRAAPENIARYGSSVVPMDEALVQAAVDLGGRPFYVGPLPSRLYEHFLQSLAINLQATVHIRVLRGRDRHHAVEAAVKALGLSLRKALAEGTGVFSTKGSVRLEWGE
jgi:imidazoleglycerol-phosphate dehydratase